MFLLNIEEKYLNLKKFRFYWNFATSKDVNLESAIIQLLIIYTTCIVKMHYYT